MIVGCRSRPSAHRRTKRIVYSQSQSIVSAPASFFGQVATVIGARRRPTEVQSMLRLLTAGSGAEWRAATLDGLARGMRGRNHPFRITSKARSCACSYNRMPRFDEPLSICWRWLAWAKVKRLLRPSNAQRTLPTIRKLTPSCAPIPLGARADRRKERRTFLEQLIKPTEPEAVQIAAVRLGRIPGEETARFLLKDWRGMTANVRMEAADALYRDPVRIPVILAALQNGDIQPWTLAFRH